MSFLPPRSIFSLLNHTVSPECPPLLPVTRGVFIYTYVEKGKFPKCRLNTELDQQVFTESGMVLSFGEEMRRLPWLNFGGDRRGGGNVFPALWELSDPWKKVEFSNTTKTNKQNPQIPQYLKLQAKVTRPWASLSLSFPICKIKEL